MTANHVRVEPIVTLLAWLLQVAPVTKDTTVPITRPSVHPLQRVENALLAPTVWKARRPLPHVTLDISQIH